MLNTQELHAQHLKYSPLARIHEALESHECDMCGSVEGFIYTLGDGYNPQTYCPKCARDSALTDAAQDQLERLLIPVVRAWAKHWSAVLSIPVESNIFAGMLQGLGESFERVSGPALESLES